MAERKIYDELTGHIEDFVSAHANELYALEKDIRKRILKPLQNFSSKRLSQTKSISLIDNCINEAQISFLAIARRRSLDPWLSLLRRFPRQSGFSEGWVRYVTLGLIRYAAVDRDSTLGRVDSEKQFGLALYYTDEDIFDVFRIAYLGRVINDLSGKRRWIGKGARLRPNKTNPLYLDIPEDVALSVAEYEKRRPSLLFLQDEGLLAYDKSEMMEAPITVLSKPIFDYLYVPDRDIRLLCRYFPTFINGSVIQKKLGAYEDAIQDIFNVSVDAIVHFFATLAAQVINTLPKFGGVEGNTLQIVPDDDAGDYEQRLGFLYRLCHLGFLRFPRDVIIRRLSEVRSPWASDGEAAAILVQDFLEAFAVTPIKSRDNIDLTLLRPFPCVYSSTSGQIYIDVLAILDFFAWIIEQAKEWYSTQHGDHFTLALKKWIEEETGGTVIKWKEIIKDSYGKNCEVDLLVLYSGKLYAIECKAYAKSRKFFRGDPDAVKQRSKKLQQAADQAKVAAKAVFDAVVRGEFICSENEVDWLVCTPTQEYIQPPDRYGYVISNTPRVCTPEELRGVFPRHGQSGKGGCLARPPHTT